MAESSFDLHAQPRGFIAGLGIAQIVSWGTLFYSFPLIADPMAADLGLSKVQIYGAASLGLACGGVAAYGVGRWIDRGHGRSVMTAGAVFGAIMLLAWSRIASPSWVLPLFIALGLAQAGSLYEPAFAVIARRYDDPREGITRLTLWGGFASTVFVPITQLLIEHLGWRDALGVLAFVQAAVAAGLNWIVIGNERSPIMPLRAASNTRTDRSTVRWSLGQPSFWFLMLAFTLYYAAFSALTLHLYPLLIERRLAPELVVLAIGLVGPAQVLGRLLFWKGAGRRSIRVIGNVTLIALLLSLVLLRVAGESMIGLLAFAAIYGAANGVMTIVRGLIVPEMLTRDDYGSVNGLLAGPGLVAKAIAPVGAAALWSVGQNYTLVLNVAIVGIVCVAIAFWAASVSSPTKRS